MKRVLNVATFLAGVFLMSVAVNQLLVPLRLAEGGVVGLAIILQHVVGLPVSVGVVLLNAPLAFLAYRERGWPFVVRSAVGVVAFSALLQVTAHWAPWTEIPLLGVVYGGVLMGVGLGLVLRSGYTTGGTDILALTLHRLLGATVGTFVLVIDACVLTLAGFVFGVETALYAGITLVISSKVIDVILQGIDYARGAMVITNRPDQISAQIMTDLERGVTLFMTKGGYTGQVRDVVYCVVQRSELTRLKEIVHEIDPRAFVIVTEVHEVLGEGFRTYEPKKS